jgi:hypothetical protein
MYPSTYCLIKEKSIMKKLITGVLIFFCCGVTPAQEKAAPAQMAKNTIYGELLGQGVIASLNFDRIFNTERKWMNSVSVGVLFHPEELSVIGLHETYGMPISYNWLLGKKSHHLDLGIGLTPMFLYYKAMQYAFNLSPKIGYRFQKPEGGIFFKATAMAMADLLHGIAIKYDGKWHHYYSSMNNVLSMGLPLIPWLGLSVGYSFK